jgi:hypothetical protein
VQFAELQDFTDAHVGLYWAAVKSDFPKIEAQVRPEIPIEKLKRSPVPLPEPVVLRPRTWVVSADEVWLLQINSTNFDCNWRQKSDGYPHFETVMEQFFRRYNEFLIVVDSLAFARPKLLQLEVAYNNWIPDLAVPDFLAPAQATHLSGYHATLIPEEQAWISQYLIVPEDSDAVARLHVECQPALRLDGMEWSKGSQFSLTFRAPLSPEVTDADLASLSLLGRQTIVQSFTDLTTEEAQKKWDRFQ